MPTRGASKQSTDQDEQFHRELLDNKEADEAMARQSAERLRAQGVDQAALDLAYGLKPRTDRVRIKE